jgi:hypothetical protein
MNPVDQRRVIPSLAALLAIFGLEERDRLKRDAYKREERRGRVYGHGSRKYSGPRPVRVDLRPRTMKCSTMFPVTTANPFAVRERRPDPARLARHANRKWAALTRRAGS